MRCWVLLLFWLAPVIAQGITIEVVKLYQPISLHRTDSGGVELDGEPLQAAVLSRPVAVSGAIPEDLVKALALPHRLATNSPAYAESDANLISLCKIALKVELKGQRLLVRLDVSELAIPDGIDLTARQILRLTIMSMERTLKEYFGTIDEELYSVSVGIIGTKDQNASLRQLATRFKLGGKDGK